MHIGAGGRATCDRAIGRPSSCDFIPSGLVASCGVQGELLEIGPTRAERAKRGPGQPMSEVRLLDEVGRKGNVKIGFEDGRHAGLEEYVATRQLVVAWGQRNAVLRDEARASALADRRGHRDELLREHRRRRMRAAARLLGVELEQSRSRPPAISVW
jgi:hypothetical protein